MLGSLDALANSEYANAGDLIGLEGNEELMGYLASLDAVTRHKTMQKLYKKNNASQGSRAEFEKFFSELPDHIKEGLLKGKLRLADTMIYSIKPINGAKTIKIFESQDIKENNLRNISNGRLPKNSAMLVSGIIMKYGVAASLNKDDLMSATYGSISAAAALANGEFHLKANKKHIIDPINNEVFVTDNFHNVPMGYYKLANPRLIHDDVDIEMEIELGTITGLNANGVVKVGLHGTITIP